MSSTTTECTAPANCPKCQSEYRMVIWQWVIFGGIMLSLNAVFFFSVFKKPTTTNNRAELEDFAKKIRVILFAVFLLTLALLLTIVLLPIKIPKCECPACPVDFPVSDMQITFLSLVIALPLMIIAAYNYPKLWESNEIRALRNTRSELANILTTEKKIWWIQVVIVFCITLLILFIVFGFFLPNLKWRRVKEKFFFEVSPERKKCLEEQVSRKNFGKKRDCSCCGKGTVGGIPPNYDQWLNEDPDTGSRWHRPDNVDYVVNTFSNAQEAVCNSCGPPSYKMYL